MCSNMITARPRWPRFWFGLLLTAALHVAILRMFAQRDRQPLDHAPHDTRPAIQWLLPMHTPMHRTTQPQPAQASPLRAASRPKVAPASRPATAPETQDQPISPAPAPEAQAITSPAEAADPFAAPPARAPTASDIMARARKDLGRIDQELRKAYPERGLPAPNDSRQARLERGFEAAHDAVPPKWYQGARTVEISPPNAHTRMYRVSTALLTYCITISEDGRKNYTNCPK
jgi:hypothetical protein